MNARPITQQNVDQVLAEMLAEVRALTERVRQLEERSKGGES